MTNRIYGLLVGINNYPPEVGKLSGCLNDVDNFHDYLRGNFDNANLAIEVLKDSDATCWRRVNGNKRLWKLQRRPESSLAP